MLYDIKRTLTSKSILLIVAILVLISLVTIPNFSQSASPPSNFANTELYTYFDNSSSYHFIAFAWNQFGQPVSGVGLNVNLTYNALKYTGSGSTNSSGVSQFVIQAPTNSNYTLGTKISQINGYGGTVSAGYSSQPYLHYNNGTMQSIPVGEVVDIGFSSNNGVAPVIDSTNSSKVDIRVIWFAPFGHSPVDYSVRYDFINSSDASIAAFNETNTKLLATLTKDETIFSLPRLEPNLGANSEEVLGIFYPNGTMASNPIFYPISVLYPQQTAAISASEANRLVVSFFTSVFGLFIPLIAIVGAFNSYGKDRISGTLDYVLAQPITRKQLTLSRYISSLLAMGVATVVAVALLDLIANYFTKSFIDPTLLISSIGALVVELSAFIGIMMLLSHLVKSQVTLIGIGIAIFITIDFFWAILLDLVAYVTGIGFLSAEYYQLGVVGQFANPAQFIGLVDTYFTHSAGYVGISSFSFPITPSAYGITIPSIVATGILWIGVPLAILLLFAIKKD